MSAGLIPVHHGESREEAAARHAREHAKARGLSLEAAAAELLAASAGMHGHAGHPCAYCSAWQALATGLDPTADLAAEAERLGIADAQNAAYEAMTAVSLGASPVAALAFVRRLLANGWELRPLPAPEACTGIAATWCPVHGDCCCPVYWLGEAVHREERHLDSPSCPLHSASSTHAEEGPR